MFGLFRACLSFSPRVVNSTDQITKLGRLTRPLVRFLRHLWRLLRAISRYRNSENDGRFAWMARSLNHIATTDLRAARMKSATGHMSEAAGPRRRLARAFRAGWRFFWPGDQVSRKVNRGLDAHAAPGPVYLPVSVFSPPTWSLCRKNGPGSSAALAPVQTFEPRRVLPSCVVNSAGKITVATPHEWRHL